VHLTDKLLRLMVCISQPNLRMLQELCPLWPVLRRMCSCRKAMMSLWSAQRTHPTASTPSRGAMTELKWSQYHVYLAILLALTSQLPRLMSATLSATQTRLAATKDRITAVTVPSQPRKRLQFL